MKCFMCKGMLEDRFTSFMVELESGIVVVKNVPSQVCRQCGEVTYNTETAKKLEAIVDKVRDIIGDVAVFEYSKIVA